MKRRVSLVALLVAILLCAAALPKSEAKEQETVIVALGDSLTAGLGLLQSESFPAKLEATLKAQGRNVTVVNAGVSGDTVSAALDRLAWALPPNTSAVIVELGGNDALKGLPPAQIEASLAKIIERVKAKGLPVLIAGMESPRNMGKDYVDQFHGIYRDLAERYGALLYPFFLDGVALDPGLMQEDGIHPNAKGVDRIVQGILPKVDELLTQVENQRR
ncbi:MAG TPA: arylesterase [Methyloceanibacter sp.]|jgi:acyl-CoA thioesterase-1|nr:arylesterase [Methyloceanibacter sp.]